ncbi:porin family protein [Chitinivibrio alkaliphilus]|uniref:Outer membrane protein beta-barrel domain-containing protein n=1 Tax=Chitinivibrio alkaliphilus ACht1 TaxID=1313304 RepID=U7DCM2_9BACT|nr:porin family protein [Chitinivibrio alkaliphilus]ERP32195.1 hypothetical protein CALK_0926 [Chitinivibrio alkaliphilus ACht1]
MRRILLSAFVALFVCGFSVSAMDLTLQPKAGLAFTNAWGDDADADMIVNFAGGVALEMGLSEKFSLQPELLWSVKGAEDGDALRLHYLEIPLLAKVDLGMPFLYAGPSMGFLLTATYDGETEVGGEDVKDWFETFDLGIAMGGGVTINDAFEIDARFNLGLLNVDDGRDFDSRNMAIGLFLGYNIPLN